MFNLLSTSALSELPGSKLPLGVHKMNDWVEGGGLMPTLILVWS